MIGYCCITIGVPGLALRTCTAKYATPEKLRELTGHNLCVLQKTLEYNLANHLRVFRISSDLIPFGSSPVNTLDWVGENAEALAATGAFARANGMRLSMHPGQYTVINSPNPDVVARAVEDLRYHARLLDALGMGPECKIVLHIGGVYGDKPAAIARFKAGWRALDEAVKARLVIENDDKMYTAADVLDIALTEGIPMVFDNLHHAINPSGSLTQAAWIREAAKTWRERDGAQKLHYSQQAAGKKPGSHSETIALAPFLEYYAAVPPGADIMLEVKDKNLSAIKCVNATDGDAKIARLEREWALYKYLVLAHAPGDYQKIRTLLQDKAAYPVEEFYTLIGHALAQPVEAGNAANAAQHAWGYFKNQATPGEAASFHKALAAGATGRYMGQLRRLAEKYDQPYLASSYYITL